MTIQFKSIGLIVKNDGLTVSEIAAQTIAFIEAKGCSIFLDASARDILDAGKHTVIERSEMSEHCDLVVVIGGDGTFLNAARSLATASIPLVGINIGRLGFLVDVSPDDIETSLEQILCGNYSKEKRFLLSAVVYRKNEVIYSCDALNDVVIHIRDVARMLEFETKIDGAFLNHQRADGLIIATPTGSTAYALSSGGPLLEPDLNVIALVPISPHTLSNRPIVIDAASAIDVLIVDTKNAIAQITCDGHNSCDLEVGDLIKVKRKAEDITLLHPPEHSHYHTLRKKLHWSEHH